MKSSSITVIKIQGIELSLQWQQAQGATIFLLHGLGCTRKSFAAIWDSPQFADSSILAIDLPGFGASAKPRDFCYDLLQQAQLLEQLLDKLEITTVHIVGHSMGGAIGVLLSDALGQRVCSFACVEGNLIGEDCGFASRRTSQYSFAEFLADGLPRLCNFLDTDPILREYRLLLERACPEAFYKSATSLVHWSDTGDLLHKFQRLGCAKRYFYGDKSPAPVLEQLRDIPAVAISNSGHFLINENPEQFYRELANFIFGGNRP